MKRDELAAHIKAEHNRVAPGIYGLADLRKFHSYLHRVYECNHEHLIGPGGQRIVPKGH